MLVKVTGTKHNWIDKNDLFVGYDIGTSCCEDADFFIAPAPMTLREMDDADQFEEPDLTDYIFDVLGKAIGIECEVSNEGCYEGDIVVFKLIHPTKPPLYLHLYNVHNGYYGHEVLTNLPGYPESIGL